MKFMNIISINEKNFTAKVNYKKVLIKDVIYN